MQIRRSMLGIAVLLTSAATVVVGQVAPAPLPDYSTLSGTPNKVLYTVDDLAGKKWHVKTSPEGPETEVFVWDLKLAKAPSGVVYFIHWEFQSADDYALETRDIENLPAGTVEVFDLRDAFAARNLMYTTPEGVIAMTPAASVAPGAIGGGGTVRVPPGIGQGATCAASGVLGFCRPSSSCDTGCNGADLRCNCSDWLIGSCNFEASSPTCRGTCAPGNVCSDDHSWGCGCQGAGWP